jgi:cell wall-associated NlpC family hydrolase
MSWGPLHRRLFAALAVTAAVVTTVLLPDAARADQITDKKAQAEAIAGRIDQLNHDIERAAEAANGAQIELDQLNQQIADAQAQVAAAEQEQATRNGQLKTYAVDAYVHGTPSSVEASAPASDLTTVDERQSYLSLASTNQQQLVDQLRASQQDLAVKLGDLDKAKSAAAAKTDMLRQEQQTAQKAVAEQNQLYAQAQGELAQLVADAQARESQRQAAAAKARAASSGPSGPGPAARGGVDAVIAEAKRQLGKPYVWGASGPDSFDCSGLTMWAWRAGGVSLPHFSGAQYSSTTHVSMSAIQPGDLIFYDSPDTHVALYIGNGTIIHAPNSRSVVRYDSLYYWDTWMAASRP